ncbi:MAG: ABC transporter permease [Oscillospiraceae bacterium]
MGAIYRREMSAFFNSSIAYIFLAVFYAFSGYFFSASCLSYATTDMSGLFSSIFIIVLIIIPVLTMRLFSEEKKQKTEQGLLTAPVSLTEIVLGKYFSAVTLYSFGIMIYLLYALVLEYFGGVAWTVVISNCIALFLLGCAFIAVACFISSLTENQVVSAIASFFALMLLYLFDMFAQYINNEFISSLITKLSFYSKYTEFTSGIFNLSSVLFFISTAVIFNFLTVRVFEKRRWS